MSKATKITERRMSLTPSLDLPVSTPSLSLLLATCLMN